MKDLSNMQFHELKVIEAAGFKLQGSKVYKCECSCGKICFVRGSRLTTGNTKSCGHLKKEAARHSSKRRIDFTGQQIDDFIIDSYSHNDEKSHFAVWKCHCVRCNTVQYFASNQLRGRHKTRCKCKTTEDIMLS